MLETAVAGHRLPVTGNSVSTTELVDGVAAVLGPSVTAAARRQAREILSLLWDESPAWIAAHGDAPVPTEVRDRAIGAARRLAAGAPLQYAAGRAAFRHLLLDVDERVIIPRPETEVVVEEALRVCSRGIAADVGTGSGAIALALATEGGFERVIATDVSSDAIAVAAGNVARLDRRGVVEIRTGALLDPLHGIRLDLLVSNPPYIAAREMTWLPASVHDWEPAIALVSGEDGLAHSHSLAAGAAGVLRPGGWLVLEADSSRARRLAHDIEALATFTDVDVRPDLAGRDRVVLARRRADPNTERFV